jgi:Trk K+ transport system NAD-binding subunit
LTPEHRHSQEKLVVICGMGHVGTRVAELMVKLGYRVVAVSKEIPVSVAIAANEHLRFIEGDACAVDIIRQVGLDKAEAVFLLTDDDLANVSVALAIRSVNPHVKLILRLFDQRLAGTLTKKLNLAGAFSASLIAAPVCVAIAMGEDVAAAFNFLDNFYTIDKGDDDSNRQKPVHLRRALTKKRHSFSELFDCFLSSLQKFPRPAFLVLSTLSIISVLAVVVFMSQLQMQGVDAFYFLVTIITTVGFGDYNLMNAGWGMKLFGCFLMLCGASLIAALFSIITDGLIRFRFKSLFSNVTSSTKDHVIVVGVGSFGYRVILELHRQQKTAVAIEQDNESSFITATRAIAPMVIGDARLDETLIRAGIARASALVILTGSDIANLAIALAAKQAWPQCRIVCRLYDSALADKAERLLGVDSILSTSAIAAPIFAGSALQNDVLCAFETPAALHLFSQESLEQSNSVDPIFSTIFPFVTSDGDRRAD